ncbi:MAG: D-glycero-beta-D-manno-heptose-7-phosphate kinase [Flavobacteriales bacterium]|jgi:rfaE bifunctional protein kinase chain/domain|nr:D-glycero-beta-D-manno-heptose-7-phosphate kinase [Flavobacteriales bacterium]
MSAIDAFLGKAEGSTVLVVGDVMVDAYLWGRVDRISPEAPVPVVQVTHRSARLGGAANVALNAKALGARAVIASVAGDDEHADRVDRLLAEQGLSPDGLVRSPLRRTTVKTRVISAQQHVVRVDEEQEDDLSETDGRALLDRIALILSNDRPNVIVLEDYNKGVLTAGVIEGIVALARAQGIPVAVDPKKKNFLAYRGVTLFKPNLKELREGLKMDIDPTDDKSLERAVRQLEERLGNAISLVTLSEHGAFVHDARGGQRIAAHKRKIIDVSGAGDTVIAVAALALAQGLAPADIAALSNLAGGLVCEEVGVAPIDRERFRSECERLRLLA